MREFTHVDCFSGPGGICTGLHAAGFKTLVAIECIRSCVDTYSANHPEVHVIESDIRNVTEEQLLPYIPEGGVDLVTSGMPCETFSTAGNRSRSFYDDRQFLFREGIRVAEVCNAKMILFENVPAITTKTVERESTELIISVLKKELRSAGYTNLRDFILDSTKYGVPQRRNRYFVLASKDPSLKLAAPKETTEKAVTVKDAFADIPNVIPNTNKARTTYLKTSTKYTDLMRDDAFWRRESTSRGLTYHMPMKHRACTIERFSLLAQGESLKDLFDRYTGEERAQLQERRVLPRKMFIKRNYRLISNEPSPTVTSHCLDEFVHPVYDRALTVRECARLQSFPDSYDFCGGPYLVPHLDRTAQDKYEQIGDAVPPLLAYAWGKQIKRIIENGERDCLSAEGSDSSTPGCAAYVSDISGNGGRQMPYSDFCQNKYNELYTEEYADCLKGRTSQAAQTAAERDAQKFAIKETLKQALAKYASEYETAELWRAIYVAHLKRKAGIADLNVIDEEIITKVISADQSWKKASGHAFESFISEVANPALAQYGIRFVLQRELSGMISNGKIHNDAVDMTWLNQRIHTDVFDLYAISSWQEHNYVFGCIQSKTSIRDRVTRDREPSLQAMNASFWSIAVALDGAFLALPKFQEMVNGGGADYEDNGWHGLYVMSDRYTLDRIYPVDSSLSLLVDHARQASESFVRARLRFNKTWRPQE